MKQDTGYPVALSVQNTKNATERAYETQKILSDAGLNKGVALSMQSVDMTTLEAIKRDNISLDTYMELQRRFTRDKVETYSDLILGLPGETYESFVAGVDQLIENGQHNRIQFNNLSILPNAEMGDPAYQAKYGMVTIESKIINIHGERIELDDDVPEVQDLVIATAAMPLADWRRTRIFCWMTALLHFDKLFQIPLILAHGISGISYRDMIEAFMARRSQALSDDRRDQRLLPERGGVDPAGRLGVRLLQGISQHLLAGRRVHLRQAHGRGQVRRLLRRGRQASGRDRDGAPLPACRWTSSTRRSSSITRWSTSPSPRTNLKVTLRYDLLDYWHKVRSGEQALLREQPMVVEVDRASQALRRLPEVVPRDRLVGQQEGRLSLFADGGRDHARARRPLLGCAIISLVDLLWSILS